MIGSERACAAVGIPVVFLFVLICTSAMAAAGEAAGDWPQFLGPDRNGIAVEALDLPRSWPAGGPTILWKIPVGPGYGGAAIYGDSVLILDRENEAQDVLRRISLANGSEVWRFSYDAPGGYVWPGSRTTPATDGTLVPNQACFSLESLSATR